MNIKTGYKQTEIGVIPEDWEVKFLDDLTTAIGDGIHSTPKYVNQSEFYFVNGNNLVDDEIKITATTQCVSETEYKNLKKPLSDRTILFSINGTIGNLAFYNGEQVVLGKSAAYLNIAKDTSKEFIAYSLKSRAISLFFENELTGSTIKNLSLQTLRNCPIPLPQTQQEQTAIAAALSDVDALMGELDKLITKKRDIKQATMQQLLTGKKRLAGFSGEWEVKRLIELVDCFDNLRVPLNESQRDKMRGDYPYCGANGVLDFVNDYTIDDDIILIAEDGGYFDEYAYRPIAYRMRGKCWVNNHAHILKSKAEFEQEFIFYSLVHKNILNFLASGTRAKLNKSEMWKIEINTPPTKEEQTAIATILSDMDAEINALQQKREKIAQLKQGMMQELLTGRIRLIIVND